MKIILIFFCCYVLYTILINCFRFNNFQYENKIYLFFKNICKKKGIISNDYLFCNENEKKLEEKIQKEERIKEIYKQNNTFINNNFKYTSNYLPINVEKKYSYETFKYTDEIIAYIFFVINLFKHEQFKNQIYKKHLEKESNRNKNELIENFIDEKSDMNTRNKKLIKNFLNKFSDKFNFFNTDEKFQREDWKNMFTIEQEDKMKFFEKVKIQNKKSKEYYFVVYYCNWLYECMALYNALHNIFHNVYNVSFYNIFKKEDEHVITEEKKKIKDKLDGLNKEDIEKIKEMYIKDLENNTPLDIESLIKNDEKFNLNEIDDKEKEENEKINDNDKSKKNIKNNYIQKNEKEEKLSNYKKIHKNNISTEDETLKKNETKKKTFQEIMEEEKKKLDEEYFLHGYSLYENEEEIQKEEENIKKTKQLLKEEEINKDKLNSEKDFKFIYKNFYFDIKNYKNYYTYFTKSEEDINKQINDKKTNQFNVIKNNEITNTNVDKKKEVYINVIFVKISNSTVIGKTKNLKEKIKKKWIYCQEKEIKFYELILSLMLNENVYYKNIPHMEIFSVNYDKKELYDYFNLIKTNLKHSFIHKNNVYDILNNVVNDSMDIYNFDIYDKSKYSEIEKEKNYQNNNTNIQANSILLEKKENVNEKKEQYNNINNDIIIEEMNLNDDIEKENTFKVLLDQNEIENKKLNNIYSDKINKLTDENNIKTKNMNNNLFERESNIIKMSNTNQFISLTNKKKKNKIKYEIKKNKHNKKIKSKYETLFKQRYTNIFANSIKKKIHIQNISKISNFDSYANYTIETFKDILLNDILKNNIKDIISNDKIKVDKHFIYYMNKKIPKEIFPFLYQLSSAFKYEHTIILLNAPKKVQFEFRNV